MTSFSGDSGSRRAVRKSLRTDFHPSFKLRAIRAAFRARQATHVPAYVLGGRLDRPIFIIGAPRSGTSLLYALLRSSSRLAHWPGEAHEVWEADYHPALRGWSSNVLGPDDLTPSAATRIRRRFFLTAGGRARLIDKTPRNSLRVGFVDALFPDAHYLFLKRDGRDNVNSLINAWRTPRYRTYRLPTPHLIPGADPAWWKFVLYPGWEQDASGPLELVSAKQWTASNDRALESSKAIEPERWTSVRYEDLVAGPVACVEALAARLELPFEEEMKRRAASASTTLINTVTPPERGKWKRENPDEIGRILSVIEPTMRALGYDQ